MRVAKVGKTARMTISAQVRTALELQTGDSVRFIEFEPERFAIARVTVKDLRSKFGPARRCVSIEEMNEAIAQQVVEEHTRSTKASATRRNRGARRA
jgi:hypothetical protein